MAMRWRWPPESVTPRSPIGVSNFCGRRPMNSEASASSAARATSASLASGRPKRMLSRDRGGEHDRCPAAPARSAGAARAGRARCSGTPSNVIVPASGIVEAQDQVEDRALAGARGPDDRDLLAAPHAQRDAVEHQRLPAASDRQSARPRRRPRRARGSGSATGRAGGTIVGSHMQDLEQPLGRAGGLRELAPDLGRAGRARRRRTPRRARTARAVPRVMWPASTSWAPTHSTTTTLANTRKIAIAVSIARARVESTAASKARSTAAPKRPRASFSLVKACSTRTAPISSEA